MDLPSSSSSGKKKGGDTYSVWSGGPNDSWSDYRSGITRLGSEDGDSIFHRNVRIYLRVHMALKPRRTSSSSSRENLKCHLPASDSFKVYDNGWFTMQVLCWTLYFVCSIFDTRHFRIKADDGSRVNSLNVPCIKYRLPRTIECHIYYILEYLQPVLVLRQEQMHLIFVK
jgi:hypothetical protein